MVVLVEAVLRHQLAELDVCVALADKRGDRLGRKTKAQLKRMARHLRRTWQILDTSGGPARTWTIANKLRNDMGLAEEAHEALEALEEDENYLVEAEKVTLTIF